MSHSKDSFVFIGFEPTGELKTIAKEVIWKVELNAPNYASRMGLVEKINDQYNGVIRVVSKIGQFEVEDFAQDPIELVNKLYRQIYARLMVWKKSRVAVETAV